MIDGTVTASLVYFKDNIFGLKGSHSYCKMKKNCHYKKKNVTWPFLFLAV